MTLLVGAMLAFSWTYLGITAPNERSRIYLSVALVDQHDVRIDKQVDRFGRILDIAKKDDHFYSDKAPGASLLGAAAYGAVRLFSEPDDWTIHDLLDLMRFGVMIPLALVAFLFLRRILFWLGLDPPVVDITSLAWILGTSAFHYSNAFFSHQLVAIFLVGALFFVEKARRRLFEEGAPSNAVRGYAALGGAMAGMAGLMEYQAGIPCALLAAYVAFGAFRKDIWSTVAFGLGALPFLGIFAGYHQWAFGGPFELSYFHLIEERFAKVHESGFLGLRKPEWEWFSGGMFSLHRGLLSTSPIFILALPGLLVLWMRERYALALLLGTTLFYYVAFIASWKLWEGGWGFGPRHLIAMMGWTAILVGCGVQWLRGSVFGEAMVRALALLGILYHQIVNAFFPELPASAKNPLVDGVYTMYRADIVTPNLMTEWTDTEGVLSLWPLGAMVGMVVAIVLFRGLGEYRRKIEQAAIVALAVVITTVPVYLVGTAEGNWTEKQQDRWVNHSLKIWRKRAERREKREARREEREARKEKQTSESK